MKISKKDITSVILSGITTAIGVSLSLPSLPSSLPEPLSTPILGGIAVLLASSAALLQVVDSEEDSQETTDEYRKNEIVRMPKETYERQLERAQQQGIDRTKHTRAHFSTKDSTISEDEFEELKQKVQSLEKLINSFDGNIDTSEIDEINSKFDDLEENVNKLRSESVSNFEFEQKRKELDERIEENHKSALYLFQIAKDHLHSWEPPTNKEFYDTENLGQEGSSEESTSETSGYREQEMEKG